jgi:hypothetical protein
MQEKLEKPKSQILCYVIYALESVLWHLCFGIYALASMLWHLWFGICALA